MDNTIDDINEDELSICSEDLYKNSSICYCGKRKTPSYEVCYQCFQKRRNAEKEIKAFMKRLKL